MKNYRLLRTLYFICFILFVFNFQSNSQIPGLDVETNGMLVPRLTTAERDALTSVQPGWVIYNTTTDCIEFYREVGWFNICEATANCGPCTPLECNSLNVTLGGLADEFPQDLLVLSNGGIIVASYTESSQSGDVTDINNSAGTGFEDIWLAKLDFEGNVIWNNLIGSIQFDRVNSIEEAPDGNIIVAGNSGSSGDGDFSGPSNGTSDIWILKVNQSDGSIIYENNYGSSFFETGKGMDVCSDGGIVLATATSGSLNNGDITDVSNGASDIWVAKLDVDGNIEWNGLYGSTGSEFPYSVRQTNDNGFIVCGHTNTTTVSGDVSTASFGLNDFWLFKLDQNGNKIWDITLGGSSSDAPSAAIEISDGSIMVVGSSSSTNGNVTDTNNGNDDIWLIKLDANGNILWDNMIGGNSQDTAVDIVEASDGNIFICGTTLSTTSGDVTNPNPSGFYQSYIVKVDLQGNVLWNTVIGGDALERARGIQEEANGCLLVLSETRSSSTGDVIEANNGGQDLWVIRLEADGTIAQ